MEYVCQIKPDQNNIYIRRAWRYQNGHQNPQIEEGQKHNSQKKKDKRTNNDLQNIHIKLEIE